VKASNRKRSILASAAPIFNQRGFAGTSIADILAATALEKGGLYNHFASKEELALATFDYAFGQVDAYFTQAVTGVESGLSRLHAFIDAFVRYSETPVVEGGCPLANAALEADDALPFLRERVALAFGRMRSNLAHNLQRAIDKGEVRAETDIEAMTDLIVSALEGALLLSRALQARVHAHRVAHALHAGLDAARPHRTAVGGER
jgi:TetR/AcrR family transcriptional repressor of nem operon